MGSFALSLVVGPKGLTRVQILHFSLLDGLSKPADIAKRCLELNYSACALTEHGGVSGIPSFSRELEKVKVKAIPGCEFYISKDSSLNKEKDNGKHSHLCTLAKGQQGWRNLIAAVSESNKPTRFYRKPRLSLEELASYSKGEFIVFSGHMGSDLANIIFDEPKLAYGAKTYEDAKGLASKNWTTKTFDLIDKFVGLFGSDNFFVEIQLIDQDNLPAARLVGEGLRWAAKKKGIPCVGTADSHYCKKEDAADQRILLCAALQTTLKDVYRKIDLDEEVGLGAFFKSNNYHIPSYEEMAAIHTESELANTVKVASICSPVKIAAPPKIPAFGKGDPNLELRKICEANWGKIPDTEVYRLRFTEEFQVIKEAKLADYFLIVADYIEAARKRGIMVGMGRGSSGGSLIAYLMGIIMVDPIKAKLSFQRFYSNARNQPEHVSFDELTFDKLGI